MMEDIKINSQKKSPIQMKLISVWGSRKYLEEVGEFWKKDIDVIDIQFSTTIDEEGSVLYSGQFTYRER
jgi:hypothetical protein